MKILIVEDEYILSDLIRMFLERETYHVDVADTGNRGVEKALSNNYDLIILDVFLPGMDGYRVLEEIRKAKNTPVIMLSAQCSPEDIERGMKLGANEYLPKPFSPKALVLKVKEYCSIS
ncbi:response regulator [Mesobacillus foraminis]|uniref:response regulator transcription factor n=1 Tax=Mesobacillus foraminis TaxID=279826 RepID=UPI00399F1AE8